MKTIKEWFKKETKKAVNRTVRDIRVTGIKDNTFKYIYLDNETVDVYVFPELIEGRYVATVMSDSEIWIPRLSRAVVKGDIVLLSSYLVEDKTSNIKPKQQVMLHASHIFAIITAADLKMPAGPVQNDGKGK